MREGQTRSRRRDSQGGYALLMVFLMAAIVALMLYQQLPRVAFETEREKEQLLIDRGEQYTRAIQLYYLANNRQYPTSIDDLEKREKRFLRRRYVDPYTGKDEWRIIHTNGGFLTDSLVQKPPGASDSQNASNTNSTTPVDQQPQINAAVLQRPSDRPLTPAPGFAQPLPEQDPNAQQNTQPNAQLNTQTNNGPLPPITLQPQQGPGALPPITLQAGGTNQPGGLPPITLAPVGGQGGQQVPGAIPGQGAGGFRVGGGAAPPIPGQAGGGVQVGLPPGFRIDGNGQLVPNTTAGAQILGQNLSGQPQGIPGQTISPLPGQPQTQLPNQNQPGNAQGSPTGALNLINQLLTTPRQATTPIQAAGNQIGAIAGIASTHKGPSIKVYKDQSQYEMWEFVFSPTASTVPGGGAIPGQGTGGPAQPGNGNQPGGSSFGAPSQGTSGAGGAQPIFGPGSSR